jgi:hypothetical protein
MKGSKTEVERDKASKHVTTLDFCKGKIKPFTREWEGMLNFKPQQPHIFSSVYFLNVAVIFVNHDDRIKVYSCLNNAIN